MLLPAIVFGAATFLANSSPVELNAYVRRSDPSYTWRIGAPLQGQIVLDLTSQTWHGVIWRHRLVVSRPATVVARDTAVLYITGDDPNKADIVDADAVSRQSGLRVAMLYNIPVQPIGGRSEDELIANTFEEYLRSGDATWPLLFPMAKSVIRAMDALGSWSHGRLKRFVLMGESKRAWTAWMAAATGDRRIIGIAPCAYDNLNVAAQMKHQMALWGHYSPAIEAYTRRGLQASLSTPRGARLARMVDPYSYLSRIKARILTVRGSNDPYWAVDSYSLYSSSLPHGSSLLILPNEGHDFKNKRPYFETVGSFAASCALGIALPTVTSHGFGLRRMAASSMKAEAVRVYTAESDSEELATADWKLATPHYPQSTREYYFVLPLPAKRYETAFVQADFKIVFGGYRRIVTLSTPAAMLHISKRSNGTDYSR